MTVRPLVLALLLTAAPAAAQELTTPAVPAPAAATAQPAPPAMAGPTRDGARAGVATAPMHAARAAQQGEEERAPRNRPGFGQPEALMIVGGAAVIIGLIVGDDAGGILAFGGAVTGLVGLYQYLR